MLLGYLKADSALQSVMRWNIVFQAAGLRLAAFLRLLAQLGQFAAQQVDLALLPENSMVELVEQVVGQTGLDFQLHQALFQVGGQGVHGNYLTILQRRRCIMHEYSIDLGRIYDASPPLSGGVRILADRLWPRGMAKATLPADEWYRDAAPEPALRSAYHHGEIEYDAFAVTYRRQLDTSPDVLVPLMRHVRQGPVLLLTASRDPAQSHLPTLRQAVLDALVAEDRSCEDATRSSPVCYAGQTQ